MDILILVDNNDREIGHEEKDVCHHGKPILHRAFSVFLFNDKDEMLITKRSDLKKTWPGFWSNSCCSHPRKDEDLIEAAHRRVKEELGVEVKLTHIFKFQYDAMYNKEWGENELDHVFIGKHNNVITPERDEITDWKFINIDELRRDVKINPGKYTPWFKICFERVIDFVNKDKNF